MISGIIVFFYKIVLLSQKNDRIFSRFQQSVIAIEPKINKTFLDETMCGAYYFNLSTSRPIYYRPEHFFINGKLDSNIKLSDLEIKITQCSLYATKCSLYTSIEDKKISQFRIEIFKRRPNGHARYISSYRVPVIIEYDTIGAIKNCKHFELETEYVVTKLRGDYELTEDCNVQRTSGKI